MTQHSRFRDHDLSRSSGRGYGGRGGGDERYRGGSGERWSGEGAGRFEADEGGYSSMPWQEDNPANESPREYGDDWDAGDSSGSEGRSRGEGDGGRRHGATGSRSGGGLGSAGRGYEVGQGRSYRGWDEERGSAWTDRQGGSAMGPRGGGNSRADQLYRTYGGFEGPPSERHGGRGESFQGGGQRGYGGYGNESGYGASSAEGYGDYGSAGREGGEGRFRGHGPKGYTRKDERICEDVCEALSQDPHLDASNIEVSVHEGVVTLTGEATSRQMKHRAENCADACSGVKDVENHLRVNRGQGGQSGASTSSGSTLPSDASRTGSGMATASGSSGSAGAGASSGTGAAGTASSGSATSGGSGNDGRRH
ncbi:BON domain-containing protein [Dyella sp.]|jgi:hypothetical protein|uniref:BON domain-containing protein n=1 Tax=Dyella sp. TaxID=1869338 RepID=UPI002D78C628|nr:BON domain-containing protein [Dyella sp.]HET6433079.1 BON domain-containing protein [Dyella sp.]